MLRLCLPMQTSGEASLVGGLTIEELTTGALKWQACCQGRQYSHHLNHKQHLPSAGPQLPVQLDAALCHVGCISLPVQAASAGDGASCDSEGSDQFQVAIALPQAITAQQVRQITRAAADSVHGNFVKG